MSLLDEALARKKRGGLPCSVGVYLASLDDEGRTEFLEALHHPSVSDTSLREALVNRGEDPPSLWMIGNHRRGNCGCG